MRPLAFAGQLARKTQPGHRAVLFSAVNQYRYEDSLVPRFHFSSVAVKNKPTSDENLLRIIESEINCAEETDDHDTVSFIFSHGNNDDDDDDNGNCLFFMNFLLTQ